MKVAVVFQSEKVLYIQHGYLQRKYLANNSLNGQVSCCQRVLQGELPPLELGCAVAAEEGNCVVRFAGCNRNQRERCLSGKIFET